MTGFDHCLLINTRCKIAFCIYCFLQELCNEGERKWKPERRVFHFLKWKNLNPLDLSTNIDFFPQEQLSVLYLPSIVLFLYLILELQLCNIFQGTIRSVSVLAS